MSLALIRSLFRRPDYRSEATVFIDQLKLAKPELDGQQQAGRALLWDTELNRQDQAAFRAGRVAQQPYVYQNHA